MQEKSFGIVPVFESGEKHFFLLIKHSNGHWSFPKGHADEGEMEIETAKRELEEETGIRDYKLVGNASFSEQYTFQKEGNLVNKIVKYFLAIVQNQDIRIQPEEISDYKWVEFDDAIKLITHKEAREVLEKAEEYLENN